METDIYLVCQIIRKGNIIFSLSLLLLTMTMLVGTGKMLQDKKYHSQHTFRRPYAVGGQWILYWHLTDVVLQIC